MPEKTQTNTPYVFSIVKNGRFLCFFGAKHSTNPDDPQFEEMDSCWKEFINKENEKKIVLIESNEIIIPDSTKDKKEIISIFGERGYAAFLAKEADIELRFPEKPLGIEYVEVLKKYDEKYVSLYYFLRTAFNNLRKSTNKSLKEIYKKTLEICNERIFKKHGEQVSLEDLRKTNREIFKKDLEMSCEDISNAVSPVHKETILNKIAFYVSCSRDLFMVDVIKKLWNDGYDIFVVFGSHHAHEQEKLLKKVL